MGPIALGFEGELWDEECQWLAIPVPGTHRHILVMNAAHNGLIVVRAAQPNSNGTDYRVFGALAAALYISDVLASYRGGNNGKEA